MIGFLLNAIPKANHRGDFLWREVAFPKEIHLFTNTLLQNRKEDGGSDALFLTSKTAAAAKIGNVLLFFLQAALS